MEKLIERIAKAPAGLKIGGLAAAVIAITALNVFVIGFPRLGASVMELEGKLERAQKEQRKLDGDLIEKTAIANNLNQFRREKEMLEQRLAEALAELPEEKNLDELLQLFQDRATKAGLEIVSIEPQAAAPEGFYARLPVPMSVNGSFHEIATFFDAVGRLRRIVNVSNITLDAPKDANGRVVVKAKFLATTFMFVKEPPPAPAGKGKKATGGKKA